MHLFNQLFENISPQEKSDYLLKLLEKKPKLKNAFMEQFNYKLEEIRLHGYLPINIEELINEIKEEAGELTSGLNELDFEETDWERWREPSHYVPEWEAAQQVAEDEAMEVFEPWLSAFEWSLKTGNLVDIIKQYLVIFHGARQCEINDPYSNLSESPEDFFIAEANNLIKKISDKFANRKFLNNDYQNTFELAFRFYNEYYGEEKELLKGLATIFIPLLINNEIAGYLWQKKEEHDINLSYVPKLVNKVTSLIGNSDLWLKSMEDCFLNDYKTSIKLMDYYFENDKSKFEEQAPQLYQTYREADTYLIKKIHKGTVFHIKLLKEMCRFNSDYYNELKKFTDSTELTEFINEMKPSNNKVKLLANEGRYDELIELIKKECLYRSDIFVNISLKNAVKLLATARPNEAWELVYKKVTQTITEAKSRDIYSEIADLLTTARHIKGKEIEVESLIKQVYNRKPPLPALKEIFRKEGLV